jgi:hypothetical protein
MESRHDVQKEGLVEERFFLGSKAEWIWIDEEILTVVMPPMPPSFSTDLLDGKKRRANNPKPSFRSYGQLGMAGVEAPKLLKMDIEGF